MYGGNKVKTKKMTPSSALMLMGDSDESREVSISLCDDDTSWRLWSFDEKATVILSEMKIPLIIGLVAPYYVLSADELVTFIKKFNKAPKDLVDTHRQKLRENLQKARSARKPKELKL